MFWGVLSDFEVSDDEMEALTIVADRVKDSNDLDVRTINEFLELVYRLKTIKEMKATANAPCSE